MDLDRLGLALGSINRILGILDLDEGKTLEVEARHLIQSRDQAREKGEFRRTDDLRTDLRDCGIRIHDSPTGAIWEHIPGGVGQ